MFAAIRRALSRVSNFDAVYNRDLLNALGNKVALWGVVTLRGGALTIPDYIAIGVLIALGAWVVARMFPRGKL